MHILVILRLVPDTSEELEISSSGNDIDREWIGAKLCEFDDHALEEAVLLKERSGASVTAVALAGSGIDKLLQTAIARGVDRVVKVSHNLESTRDTRSVATLLASAVAVLKPDAVFTGVLSPEDVLGQLAPTLAATLNWPITNAISGTKLTDGRIEARQEYSGGRSALLEVSLPAVFGIQSASQPPRYVSGTKLRQAMGVKIESIEGGQAETSRASVTALKMPPRGAGAKMLIGTPQTIALGIIEVLSSHSLLGN